LERGGFIFKNSAGVYTFLPLGWRVIEKTSAIIKEEMNSIGGQEMYMPALHEKKYLTATGRWDVDVLFKVISGNEKEPTFNISWTHEEIAAEIAAEAFDYLDAPVRRHAALDSHIPYHPVYEETVLPTEPKIRADILDLLNYYWKFIKYLANSKKNLVIRYFYAYFCN